MGRIFFLYPFLELISLFYLGRMIGFGPMIVYLIWTFFVGTSLIRSAGLNRVTHVRPMTALEAPFRFMAGVLILIPGIFSDLLAILILIPWVRKVVWIFIFSKLFKGKIYTKTWQYGSTSASGQKNESDIIDVNFIREDVKTEIDVTHSNNRIIRSEKKDTDQGSRMDR